MGCGASSPTAAAETLKAPAPPSAAPATAAEAPAVKAPSETLPAEEEVPAPPAAPEKTENAHAHVAPPDASSGEVPSGQADGDAVEPPQPPAEPARSTSALPPLPPLRASSRAVPPDSAAAPASGSAAEADGDDSRPHAHFHNVPGTDADEEAAPERPAMLSLKSSRSLNRSFGVKRRTSDADSLGLDAPEPAIAKEEEEEAAPDPLREAFERNKDSNPLLVRKTTANGMNNAISARNSEKSIRSKRPSVGFVLGEEEEAAAAAEPSRNASRLGSRVGSHGGEETDREEVDPDQHIESERVASILDPREERAAPVTARHSGGGGEGAAPAGAAPVAAG